MAWLVIIPDKVRREMMRPFEGRSGCYSKAHAHCIRFLFYCYCYSADGLDFW